MRDPLCSQSGLRIASNEARQDNTVPNSLNSPVLDRKVHKSPSGDIGPDQHHSADARTDCHFTSHGVAKSLKELPGKRPRLKLPKTLEEWDKLDDELHTAICLAFDKRLIKRWSCSKLVLRFESFLYNFIAERIPQEDEKKNKDTEPHKSRSILRAQAALAENRRQKNLHKKRIRLLKREGYFGDQVAKYETKIWRGLLKTGNRLRRRLKQAEDHVRQRRANTEFRADPHCFAKKLFNPSPEIAPTRPSKERCEHYFPNLYKDGDRKRSFKPMRGMSRPKKPSVPLDLKKPLWQEFERALKSKRNAASPGRNGVNYLVYKRLPSAAKMLFRIIRKAWCGDIPESWAQAAVTLIYKDEDPSDPANYRPIALQSCSGKIFFSIWAKRLEDFMTKNGYFKRSKQKGFLQGIPGCSEHIAALKAALRDAKSSYRQIVVAWIDLKNAFGSVSHNLIQFALHWYHVPPHLAKIIFTYYDMLLATIETPDWSSKCFAYEIGVFQGCVISPLLFNMVFNLLLDLLLPPTDQVGYHFKSNDVVIHDLAYADDLSIVASSPKRAQRSLDLLDRFLAWSKTMEAKPRKCKSLGFKYWTAADEKSGRTRLTKKTYTPFDPGLKVAGKNIEFIAHDPFKFLGWKVYHHLGEKIQKQEIRQMFEDNMVLVDKSHIHGFMKLWLYQHYVVSYLAWPFMVYDLDVSFVKNLELTATRYLKRWAGIYRQAITSILYRTREQFGLQLTSLVKFYKRLQVGQAYLLKHSADAKLSQIYATLLVQHNALQRVWRPTPVLEQLESQVDHKLQFNGQTDRAGLGAVPGRYKRKLSPKERKERILETLLTSLVDTLNLMDIDKALQGCYLRFEDTEPFDLSWRHLLGTRNPRLISWVLNASINSVITPDLRKLWGLTPSASCALCGHDQASLFHILVGCRVALQQRRYSWRHDSVLATFVAPLQRRLTCHNRNPPESKSPRRINFLSTNAPQPQPQPSLSSRLRALLGEAAPKSKPSRRRPRPLDPASLLLRTASDWKMQVDFTKYPVNFPVHICVTDSRPDIVIYSDNLRTVILIELTCPAEENIADARLRKRTKYTPLKDQIEDNKWSCHLMTIEVGARGLVSGSIPRALRRLGFCNSEIRSVVRNVSISAARCSFAIYRSSTVRTWSWNPLVIIDDDAKKKR